MVHLLRESCASCVKVSRPQVLRYATQRDCRQSQARSRAREEPVDGGGRVRARGDGTHPQGKHGARSTKQAIAIGLSKARRAGVPLKPPRRGRVSSRTQRSAKLAYEEGQGRRKPRAPSRKRARAAERALQREGRDAASPRALASQARGAAKRRGAADRSRAAKQAARTKGPRARSSAAKRAAATRRRSR